MKTRRCPRCCGGGLTIRPIYGDGTVYGLLTSGILGPLVGYSPLPCTGCAGTGRLWTTRKAVL